MKLLNDRKRVELFERGIIVDEELPKFKNLKQESEVDLSEKINKGGSNFIKDFISNEESSKFNIKISGYLLKKLDKKLDRQVFDFLDFEENVNVSKSDYLFEKLKNSNTFFEKLMYSIKFLFTKTDKKDKLEEINNDKKYSLNVIQLFDNIKILASKEKDFINRVDQYVELIKKAQALHQTAQEEQLIDKLIIHVYESVLSVCGFNKYITETDLINLQSKCEKVLRIDYIENFVRVVPDEVVKKKLVADSLFVFDNYCVLYYDPSGESFSETEKQKEERIKKDPILFGVISGSRKLYYIADWIDELCDLTLEQVVEKIGKVKELE